jgi:uncharacterized protein (TIGR03435 family)
VRLLAALLLTGISALPQTSTPAPTFEVAFIRPSNPQESGGAVQFLPGGRFVVSNCPLNFIVQQVYGLSDFQITGGPKWISDGASKFDIQAKSAEPAPDAQLRIMAQALLAERFGLRVHRETREMPVYVLATTKQGPMLDTVAKPEQDSRRSGIEMVANGVVRGNAITMDALVRLLSSQKLGRPVLDKTGVTGLFSFRLEWTPESGTDDKKPSLFVALQEQLGLKLEAQKAPVEVLVIDRAEKPAGN